MNVTKYEPMIAWDDRGFAPQTTEIKRVVAHRTANPDAGGLRTMQYFDNSRAASIHAVIDGSDVLLGVEPGLHAWHVREARKAQELGYRVSHPAVQNGKARGDICAFGIEVVEHWRPGEITRYASGNLRRAAIEDGKTYWTDETIETLIEFLTVWLPNEIGEYILDFHSELDPWERPHDPDGLLAPALIRTMIADARATENADQTVQVQTSDMNPSIIEPAGFSGTIRYENGKLVEINDDN